MSTLNILPYNEEEACEGNYRCEAAGGMVACWDLRQPCAAVLPRDGQSALLRPPHCSWISASWNTQAFSVYLFSISSPFGRITGMLVYTPFWNILLFPARPFLKQLGCSDNCKLFFLEEQIQQPCCMAQQQMHCTEHSSTDSFSSGICVAKSGLEVARHKI